MPSRLFRHNDGDPLLHPMVSTFVWFSIADYYVYHFDLPSFAQEVHRLLSAEGSSYSRPVEHIMGFRRIRLGFKLALFSVTEPTVKVVVGHGFELISLNTVLPSTFTSMTLKRIVLLFAYPQEIEILKTSY